jgi:hypothetical protein
VVGGRIGWEIFLSYRGEQLQSRNFDNRQNVLMNLENSSAATADSLENRAQNSQDSAIAADKQIEFLQTERQNRNEAVFSALCKELSCNDAAVA